MPDGGGPPTDDRLLGGRVLLRQPAAGYRAAIDPVLLAAAAPVGAGERVLDLGCGVGAAALCLLARVPACTVVGLELQPALAALARANAAANGVADRFDVVEGDVASPPAPLAGGFDHVITNPPYLPARGGTAAPDPSKAAANAETTADLGVWVAATHRLLKPKGRLTMIHRADRLDEICAILRPRFGAVEIVPLWPRRAMQARRVVLRARRDVRTPAALLPGLVLHDDGGGFTAAADAVLRDAAAI